MSVVGKEDVKFLLIIILVLIDVLWIFFCNLESFRVRCVMWMVVECEVGVFDGDIVDCMVCMEEW